MPSALFQIGMLLAGAFLAIIGGFLGVLIRVRVERKAEIDFIKICLVDELKDICAIIQSIKDTFKKNQTTYVEDINKLDGNTYNFDEHKKRIYLITNENLRKRIREFYKELYDTIRDSLSKAGTLKEGATPPHEEIVRKMEEILKIASNLKTEIGKYKYLPLWFNGKGKSKDD